MSTDQDANDATTPDEPTTTEPASVGETEPAAEAAEDAPGTKPTPGVQRFSESAPSEVQTGGILLHLAYDVNGAQFNMTTRATARPSDTLFTHTIHNDAEANWDLLVPADTLAVHLTDTSGQSADFSITIPQAS